jgi:MFS family permease
LEDDKSLGDPWARVSVAAQKGRAAGPEQDLARDIATLMRHVHAIVDQQHLAANESRRRLLTAGYAAAAVSALIVLAAIFLKSMPFLVGAENFPGVPSWQVVILVALGGVVGGCWGAFPAFTSATRDRFRLQYARAFTRLAMGVLSALIGVSLMGAGWVANLTGSAAPSLFAVAVAFGLAQEPITKILEKKAGHVPSEPSDTAEESYTASRSGVIREVGARTGAQRGNGQLVKPGYEGPDSRRTS